ncbi:hypothetical protein D1Y84_01990 [Acidipila sp. EB88]|nr:hypothetical protein D1Y84_01990 [Acidipila sp. EB88]
MNMSDTQQMSEVGTQDWAGWRRAKRAELLARRASLSPADHAERSERVLLRLEALALPPAAVVGFYWPFRAEIDVMPFIERLREQGRAAALPRVVGKGEPLEFRLWEPGVPMDRGVFGIPFPRKRRL